VAEWLVEGDELVLHLRPAEKFLGFHGDIKVPLAAVRSVSVVHKPWLTLRGWRMAGTALRGSVALGTWRHGTGYDFCAVRLDRPAVRVEATSGRFSRLVVSVRPGEQPEEVAARLAEAAGVALSPKVN